jgi:hypothetical protein
LDLEMHETGAAETPIGQTWMSTSFTSHQLRPRRLIAQAGRQTGDHVPRSSGYKSDVHSTCSRASYALEAHGRRGTRRHDGGKSRIRACKDFVVSDGVHVSVLEGSERCCSNHQRIRLVGSVTLRDLPRAYTCRLQQSRPYRHGRMRRPLPGCAHRRQRPPGRARRAEGRARAPQASLANRSAGAWRIMLPAPKAALPGAALRSPDPPDVVRAVNTRAR